MDRIINICPSCKNVSSICKSVLGEDDKKKKELDYICFNCEMEIVNKAI